MNLTNLSISNKQFTLAIFILLLIFGMKAFLTMPRTENPVVYIPGGSIIAVYPGASPADLEKLIAIPVEEAINELDDIKQINTSIVQGIVSIAVEFSYGPDPKKKFDELDRSVQRIRGELPQDLYSLQTMRWSSSDVVISHLALVSDDETLHSLKSLADQLADMLKPLPGISRVEVLASPKEELQIRLNPSRMAAMNISVNQVVQVIKSQNKNIPGGAMRLGSFDFTVITTGSYEDTEQVMNTVISSYQGKMVTLRQIAEVEIAAEKPNYLAYFRHDTMPMQKALFITMTQKENFNIFGIMEGVEPVLEEFRMQLPDGVELHTVFNQAEFVDDRINGFLLNLLQGILLVGFVVMLAMGLRSSLLVILAIPLSIAIGLGFVDLAGYGLQQISIAALVVALGLLVDNSIVMVENINRHLASGLSRIEASKRAASEIGWPMVSSTVTTLLAFVPIILMPDKAGDFIKSLPVTIIFTLSASLIIALSLTPMLAAALYRGSREVIQSADGNRDRIATKFGEWVSGKYRLSLGFALRRPWIVVAVTLVCMGGALALFPLVGVSFFPKAEQPHCMVRITLPEGASIEATTERSRKVAEILDTMPAVAWYAVNIGSGNPRIYYNTIPRQHMSNYAEIYVRFREYEPGLFEDWVEQLRSSGDLVAGVKFIVKEFEQGIPIEAPIVVYFTGRDVDRLHAMVEEAEFTLEEQPGAINVENHFRKMVPEFYININRNKAALLGVPLHEADMAVRMAVQGAAVDRFTDKRGESYDIVIKLAADSAFSPDNLSGIHLTTLSGRQIPLNQIAKSSFRSSQGRISRYNMQRNAAVTADLAPGYSLDEVMNPFLASLEKMDLSGGYKYIIRGESESRKETFGGMGMALLLAAIAIFAVLVLQFRSFIQPLIIFIAFPLGAIGMIIALLVTGNTFSFTAFIGFISLSGIVINNSIILVDYVNRLLREGEELKEALIRAGSVRMRPIMLTTLTTIGGLLPLTLQGGSLWAPMGWTIIGGLLVSTVLTLIVVPVMFLLMSRE